MKLKHPASLIFAASFSFAASLALLPLVAHAGFVSDTFTDAPGTALSAHTPNQGGTWTHQTGGGGNLGDYQILPSGDIVNVGPGAAGGNNANYTNAAAPPSANYVVSGTIVVKTNTVDNMGLLARSDSTAANRYLLRYDDNGKVLQLYRLLSSGNTALGSFSVSWAAGSNHPVAWVLNGAVLSVYVDNNWASPVINVTDSSPITTAGFVGVASYIPATSGAGDTATTGLHMEAFKASLALVQAGQSAASVIPGGTATLTASVLGTGSVTYSVQEGTGGGTITSGGVYSAPSSPGTYHVLATSTADATEFASTTVTVAAITPPSTPAAAVDNSGATNSIVVYTPSSAGSFPLAGYALFRGTSAGGEAATAVATSSTGVFTGLAKGNYFDRVRAYDNQSTPNYSVNSAEISESLPGVSDASVTADVTTAITGLTAALATANTGITQANAGIGTLTSSVAALPASVAAAVHSTIITNGLTAKQIAAVNYVYLFAPYTRVNTATTQTLTWAASGTLPGIVSVSSLDSTGKVTGRTMATFTNLPQ